jgi:radical SAM superfamily enzyme YgiQ (UPF0313 family)
MGCELCHACAVLSPHTRNLIRQRLADEVGRILKQAPLRIALAYPSPYHVAMSSLGFQRIYRAFMETPGMGCERAFLPDNAAPGRPAESVLTYESLAPLEDFPIVALSVAYELEIAGVIQLLTAANLPPLAEDRSDRHPFILAGGPLTFSNPVPLGPYVDAILMGEAEELAPRVCQIIADAGSRAEALRILASMERRAASYRSEGRRCAVACLGAYPDSPYGAIEYVSVGDGAGMFSSMYLLRNAPLYQRRHASCAERDPIALDPCGCKTGRLGGRCGKRSSKDY